MWCHLAPADVGGVVVRDLASSFTGDTSDEAGNLALGRLGGFNFLATAVIALVTLPFLDGRHQAIVLGAAVATFLSGVVVLSLPWDRWPREALVLQSAWSLVVFTAAARMAPEALTHYLPVYTGILLFVGLTQQVRFVLEMGLLMTLGFLIATAGLWVPSLYLDFGMTLGLGVVGAVLLSLVLERVRVANEHIDRMLQTTRELARATDVDDAVERVRRMVRRLTGADVVLVLLTTHADGDDLYGFDVAGTQVRVDLGREMPFTYGRLRHGEADFIEDLSDRLLVPAELAHTLRAGSALFVPIQGELGAMGALVAAWRAPRRGIDRVTTRSMLLVGSEAGLAIGRHRESDRVQRQALTDPLTGLLNRRAFDDLLSRLEPGDAVMLIDLDHFKGINDTDGHAAGDRALRSLAACITGQIRSADAGARIGGDELAVILRGAGPSGGRRIGESLRESWNASSPPTTISVGIATHAEAQDPAATLARADRALYAAKERGRDRCVGGDAPVRRPGTHRGARRRHPGSAQPNTGA